MTVVIKGDNRKKHNSHEWFLQGFAEAYPAADLLFLSDCGSSYKAECIRRLASFLVDHPDFAAVTGMLGFGVGFASGLVEVLGSRFVNVACGDHAW